MSNHNEINTVGDLRRFLKGFPDHFDVITNAKGSVYDGRILSVYLDPYEKKEFGRDTVMIKTT